MARTITFYPSGGGDPVELGDDSVGHRVSGFTPAQERNVSTVQLAFANYAAQFDWGNYFETVTWRVERDHGTPAAAVIFMRDHPGAIPFARGRASSVLQELGDDVTANVRFLQGSAIISARCVAWDGQSTIYEYTARGTYWSDVLNP